MHFFGHNPVFFLPGNMCNDSTARRPEVLRHRLTLAPGCCWDAPWGPTACVCGGRGTTMSERVYPLQFWPRGCRAGYCLGGGGQHRSHLQGQVESTGPGSCSSSVQKLDSARKVSPTLLADPLYRYFQVKSSEGQGQPGMNCLFVQNMRQLNPSGHLFRENGAGRQWGAGLASCHPGHCPPGKVLHGWTFLPWERGWGQDLHHGSWRGCPSDRDAASPTPWIRATAWRVVMLAIITAGREFLLLIWERYQCVKKGKAGEGWVHRRMFVCLTPDTNTNVSKT